VIRVEVDVSSELGLFVLWSESRFAQDRVLADIEEHFHVRRVYEVFWTPDHITANFARFYRGRAQPPYRAAFEEQKGRGPFLLVTVADEAPHYAERPTLKGLRVVNARFFDAKMRHREWIGGKMRVHATDSVEEARRDLSLLLGRDAEHYLEEHPGDWDGRFRVLRRDLVGANGWVSRAQLREILGATVNYVALSGTKGEEPLVLLTDDYHELVRIANAWPCLGQLPRWGGEFHTAVARKEIPFEIRFVGDDYLDPGWARSILERRVVNPGGFCRPAEADARDFAAYHAFAHRSGGSKPTKQEVDALLERYGAEYTRPRDPMVHYDFRAVGAPSPLIHRAEAALKRTLWQARHRLHRPLSATWWRIREPLRRRVGWLRHMRAPLDTLRAG
jgi:hypothetical protein